LKQIMSLIDEIHEQPDAIRRLLGSQSEAIATIAGQVQARGVDYIYLAARGTSDNAGKYAQYLFGAVNRLPMALAAPSLFSLYQQPPLLNDALVIGVSQSGRSPDIISVMDEARRQGVMSLAVTNSPVSPMADAAEFVLDINCAPEVAVAATKSYTGSLAALALLSAELAGREDMRRALERVPGWMEEVLAQEGEIAQQAEFYRSMDRCVVLGRGYNYATVYEWSLKLKELAGVMAEPYSSADFLHGPIAMVQGDFPVFTVAPGGSALPPLYELLQRLREDRRVGIFSITDRDEVLSLSRAGLRLPVGIPEWLSPLIAIIPGQLFAYHLTRHKGLDPDNPTGLSKVTRTQ